MARATRADLPGGLFIGASAILFGAVVVLGKFVERRALSVASLLVLRFGIAALILAGVLLVTGRPIAAARGEGWRLVALGVGGYAVESAFFFAALPHGTVPAVTLLFFVYPVFVALTAVALGKGPPGRLLVGALVAAVSGAAVVVLAGGRATIDAAGVGFALASALMFSLYLTGAGAVLRKTSSLTGAMWVSASAAVALAAWAAITRTAGLPSGWREWAAVAGMAVATAGAFFLLFAGLRRIGAVRTSIVAASEPLAASLLAVVFLRESIHPGTLLGGMLILGGAVAASLARGEPLPQPQGP